MPTLPPPAARIVAFDYLRGFVTALVVLHHSVLAYCSFGYFNQRHYLWSTAPIVDGDRWSGFDVLVLFNDSYFMPLMFLLSGLFVWPSLVRKGAGPYLRDRLLRLGLPFAVAAVIIMPIAYYPSFRMTGADAGFGRFWSETMLIGPWPNGPAWFLGVLLAFDVAVISVQALRRRRTNPARAVMLRPLGCFGLLAVLSGIAYVPLLAIFGPGRWLTFGPFAVQASRMLFYGVYFLAGVVAGRHGPGCRVFAPDGLLQRRWISWMLLSALLFAVLVSEQVLWLAASAAVPPLTWSALYGCALVLFCAAANFALLAAFLRFAQRRILVWESLSANAYGIYIIHYPIVIWAQYAMAGLRLNAILKASIVFPAALLLSWIAANALRHVPGAARVM